VSSPLLETSINGASDAIINVTGGANLALSEVETVVETIRGASNTDINTIFGAVINENLNDEIIVTVIATGFEEEGDPLYHPYTRREELRKDIEDVSETTEIPTFLRKRGL
ncbi:MAG: cell division protein FtsZ, partial [Bacilli bacterium]|nr:cell division protein FtsZ [Bacilli bacterium]